MIDELPLDQPARERILLDLGSNLLVEAGAGSGKTTSMVARMVALIRTGTARIEEIAAVTFTRKAAAELRERFQEKLESAYRESFAGDGDPAERERLDAALAGLDRCFVGTIHSFCARLLRERSIEAGVPPDFEEISGADERRARVEAWSRFLDRLNARPGSHRLTGALRSVRLTPAQLRGVYERISDNPDVVFRAPVGTGQDPAELARVRLKLRALLDSSLPALPPAQPAKGWDGLQAKIRALRFSADYPGWDDDADFLEALGIAVDGGIDITQNRWDDAGAAKEVQARWSDFRDEPAVQRVYAQWLARRYRVAVRFARAAAGNYTAERRRSGRLTFQDLLMRTTALLRSNPAARRELGSRYRRLLVDEFQDTDPIQAEILFLLSADGPDWRAARPRPGSLFVVGDPKQSIYRFRRADIDVYNEVKARFGADNVVELTANFRSTEPIGSFVNEVFRGDGGFPGEATAVQAKYAPMVPAKADRAGGRVLWYAFDAPGRGQYSGRRIAEPDSATVAALIAGRVARGENRPGDFLVLTRTKGYLAAYARALEGWDIPVQVSGSRADVSAELDDLLLVLRALADPGDPVLTVACLEGLFFGCSHRELYEHVRAGGGFSFLPPEQPAGPVGEALAKLREWWLLARRAPADVVVDRIFEELTLLPFVAAGELGAARAGVLEFVLETLRAASADGGCSLVQAVEVLEQALDDEVEAPLVPGMADVVRVMNLHKAKGLEAKVVVLSYPAAERDHPPTLHVRRRPDGPAEGWLVVSDATRNNGPVLARPLTWEVPEALERAYQEAESLRLLYVAATRAGDELIVARCSGTEDRSPWALLHPGLDDAALASRLDAAPASPPPRPALTAAELASVPGQIQELQRRREALSAPTYNSAPVTARAKGGSEVSGPASGRGAEWGTAIHQALEAAGRGLAGDALRAHCRGLLVEAERPLDSAGEPLELDELLTLVDRVRASELWRRADAAEMRLMETPFRVAFSGEELPDSARGDGAPLPLELVDGVIDLVFREPGKGWVLCDYKSDAPDESAGGAPRLQAYRRQVELYADCWQRITGEPVAERALLFLGGAEPRSLVW